MGRLRSAQDARFRPGGKPVGSRAEIEIESLRVNANGRSCAGGSGRNGAATAGREIPSWSALGDPNHIGSQSSRRNPLIRVSSIMQYEFVGVG
jgi:hypothetical protein